MENIVSPTTIALGVAVAGAGAVYVYQNVVDPQTKQQRTVLAEQAQKELLEEHAIQEAAKRGNKKPKKKPVQAARPKKVAEDNDANSADEVVDERVISSNPYELLNTTPVQPVSKKAAKKAAAAAAAAAKASSAPVTPVAPIIISAAVITPITASVNIDQAKVKEPKVSAKNAKAAASEAVNVDEPVKVAESIKVAKPVGVAESVKIAAASIKIAEPIQAKAVKEESKIVEKIVEKTVIIETMVPNKEFEALRSQLAAKEKEMEAAAAETQKAKTQMETLQQQLNAKADVVKAAKKAESRVQDLNAQIESFSYTNSLLVKELTAEKEKNKAIQEQAAQALEKSGRTKELEKQIQDFQDNRAQLGAGMEQMKEINLGLQQKLARVENDAKQMLHNVTDANHRTEAALRELNEIRHNCSMILTEKDTRITRLENECRSLESGLENSKFQVEQYANAVSHAEEVARSQAESFEADKHSLIEEIDILRSQLDREVEKVAKHVAEVKRVQDELKASSTKHDEHIKRVQDEYTATSNKLKERISALSTKESSFSAREAELSSNMAAAVEELTVVQEKFATAESGLAQLKTEVAAKIVELTAANEKVAKVENALTVAKK
ncbi:hypothetical protein BGZ95_006010, partial [Linnemannia exigua]